MKILAATFSILLLEISAKCTLHVHKANLDWDPEYLNVTWDDKNFVNGPPEFPFDYTPEPTLVAIKDLKQLAIFISIKRQNETSPFASQKISFCSNGGGRSGFVKPLLEALMEYGKFSLRCNQKKGTKLTIKKLRLRNLFIVKLLKNCYKIIDDFEFRILEDKKPSHLLFKAILPLELTEIPK